MPKTTLKVLHTPVNIGSQASSISSYEKKRGHLSVVAVQYDLWTKVAYDYFFPVKKPYDFLGIFKRCFFSLKAAFKFNVFHFYFGRTLLTWDDSPKFKPFLHWDIKIAKLLKKKVIATFQGCDIRIAAASQKRNSVTMCDEKHCKLYKNCINYSDQYRLNMYATLSKYYDAVFYLNPELGHHLPTGQFLPYSTVDVKNIAYLPPKTNSRPIILHAPSDSSIKGTEYIVAALAKLENEFDFEFKLIQNLPTEKAMEIYRDADLVIDQVLAGWYGAFAVELMAMGKPVACYIREEDMNFIPQEMKQDLPLLNVNINQIEADLRNLLSNRDQWTAWGKKSRDFAIKWHDPEKISNAFEEVYTNSTNLINYSMVTGK